MILQDIDIYVDKKNTFSNVKPLNIQSNCVSHLYLRQIGDFNTHDCQKISVSLHELLKNKQDIPAHNGITIEEMKERIKKGIFYYQNFIDRIGNTFVVHRRFDFETYFKQTDAGKKRMLLDELHAGVMHVAQHFGWDVAPLQTAYQRCIDANLQNHFVAKRLGEKTSPNRQHKAHVWVEYDLTEIRLYLHVTDKTGNTIINQQFYTLNGLDETTMYPDDVMPILHGKLAWQGNEVIVNNKKGNEIARINCTQSTTVNK